MAAAWAAQKPYVDAERFSEVSDDLRIQQNEARWWRDASIAYWQSLNHFGLPDGVRQLPVRLAGARTEVAAARGLPAPQFVLPTGAGLGYGGFVLDPASLQYVLANLPEIQDPLTRGAAWVTLWEQLLDGSAPTAAVFDLALAHERRHLWQAWQIHKQFTGQERCA